MLGYDPTVPHDKSDRYHSPDVPVPGYATSYLDEFVLFRIL